MDEQEKPKKEEVKEPAEEGAAPYPDMKLAQDIHCLIHNLSRDEEVAVVEKIATELRNPSLYTLVRDKLHGSSSSLWTLTATELKEMEDANQAEYKKLIDDMENAKENAGDMEVMDAAVAAARFAAKSLSEKEAIDAYERVLAQPKVSAGKKLDATMAMARVASFYSDVPATDKYIASGKEIAENADWDRRNRFKVYSALQKLLHRDLKGAADLMLDGIATFSCSEISTYQQFIVYAVLTNLLHLSRPELKAKVLDSPEILSVAEEIPKVMSLVNAFYKCEYKTYLHAMVEVESILLNDRYLYPHASYWMRELHILAYKQYLDSYQTVQLQAMAEAFGVSSDFIDTHASRFIAAGRLSAKIDKYGSVIVTQRPDLKNAHYREMIQKGDLLLNRIQKLARVVDL